MHSQAYYLAKTHFWKCLSLQSRMKKVAAMHSLKSFCLGIRYGFTFFLGNYTITFSLRNEIQFNQDKKLQI